MMRKNKTMRLLKKLWVFFFAAALPGARFRLLTQTTPLTILRFFMVRCTVICN